MAKDTTLLQPTPCFVVNGVQHYDVSTHIERETARVYCRTFSVEHYPRDPTLHVYTSLVMRGKLTWPEHLRCVALPHNIHPSTPSQCVPCRSTWSVKHIVQSCPFRSFFWYCVYTRSAGAISKHVLQWVEHMPTTWGVLVRWGGTWLGLAVQRPETCPVPEVHRYHVALGTTWCSPRTVVFFGTTVLSDCPTSYGVAPRACVLSSCLLSHTWTGTLLFGTSSYPRPIPFRLSNSSFTRSRHPSGRWTVYRATCTRVRSCLL